MWKSKSLSVLAGVAAIGALALLSSPAHAGPYDDPLDPQIFVQQSGSAPAGGDPNLITDTSAFVVGVAGNHTLQNPLLVVLALYNGTGTASVSFTGGVSSASPGTYGLTTNTATFTALSSGSAFDQLGLASGGSENFGNFSAADVANGFAAPSSFTLVAFALNTSLSNTTGPITIDTGASAGSFILAYSCEAGTGTPGGACSPPGNIGQTVFTNTGLITTTTPPVPEPASLALLGTALLGLGFLAHRGKSKGM